MNNRLPAELLAEFLGTMVLILFGNGVVTSSLTNNGVVESNGGTLDLQGPITGTIGSARVIAS